MASASGVAKPRAGMVWVQGLACGGLIAWMPASATLAAILLAPGLIAYLADRRASHAVGRVVLMFGATMAPQSLITLWYAGNTMATSLGMAADMRRIASAWAVQAGGWLLMELAPVVVRVVLDANAQARIALLRRRRVKLEDEWGLPPLGDDADRPMAPP